MPKCDFQVRMISCDFPYVKSFENKGTTSSKGTQAETNIETLEAILK
jgi:hypothetical protein